MRVRVASAGTGKTTSLVKRYLELIASGTPLRRIAGVTFTRSAANELKQRVGEALREVLQNGCYLDLTPPAITRPFFEEARRELEGATLSTIHGFMIESLRLVAPQMGLDPNFRVLGEWQAQALFEEELSSLLYLARDPQHGLYSSVTALGSQAESLTLALFKQRSLSETFTAGAGETNASLSKLFDNVYSRYRVRLGAGLLSPPEVERRALQLVMTPAAVTRLLGRYRILLIDEFQDVNPLQGRFFEALEAAGLPIEVVGDPKQSIYSFRHADVEVFRRALKTGETLPPLNETRRHTKVLTRFLNHMTQTFASHHHGFSPEEAPDVQSVGEQAEKDGRIELHWIVGDEGVNELRRGEARVLAERLRVLSETHPYAHMAVLARSYVSLRFVEEALLEAKLPYVLRQGRGYYERIEVRDLYHALKVGVEPAGLSLAAWLRSPFAALELHEIEWLLLSEDPLERLKLDFPEVYGRLEHIRQALRGTPLDALKILIRDPFIGGRRYVDFLEPRARENVDALLFTVAEEGSGELELLLDRLDLLSRQADAGDVPQSGEGILLLTIHAAKGLEWPVVALFDTSRRPPSDPPPLAVDAETGRFALQQSEDFDALYARAKTREENELYRLLYVAASRARDVLLMTGSISRGNAEGWAKALHTLNVGSNVKPYSRPDFILQTYPYAPVPMSSSTPQEATRPLPSPWLERHFSRHPFPPVFSPSGLKREEHEPLPLSDPDEGEIIPGRARTVGTLVHYAISQNWRSRDAKQLENLRAQEVMFPFSEGEKDDILTDVQALVTTYERLLGRELPALAARAEDYPELPMALAHGATVWQGIIDRLYRVRERWYLEDYKTDTEMQPDLYYFQLAVYLRAIRAVKGVTPQVQLVYLRFGEVVVVEESSLEGAFAEAQER